MAVLDIQIVISCPGRSDKKCPKCGGYMVEKGNKLLCASETCGYTCEREKKENE